MLTASAASRRDARRSPARSSTRVRARRHTIRNSSEPRWPPAGAGSPCGPSATRPPNMYTLLNAPSSIASNDRTAFPKCGHRHPRHRGGNTARRAASRSTREFDLPVPVRIDVTCKAAAPRRLASRWSANAQPSRHGARTAHGSVPRLRPRRSRLPAGAYSGVRAPHAAAGAAPPTPQLLCTIGRGSPSAAAAHGRAVRIAGRRAALNTLQLTAAASPASGTARPPSDPEVHSCLVRTSSPEPARPSAR